MGWDTNIVIMSEGIPSRQLAQKLAQEIFNEEVITWNNYGITKCYLKKSKVSLMYNLFYFYEKRKFAPIEIIKQLSKKYSNNKFTILASSPDFVAGPGGVIRIKKGEVVDSYGIQGRRHYLLLEIEQNEHKVYNWFKSGSYETKLRIETINEYPIKSCNERYSENMIPVDNEKMDKFFEIPVTDENWILNTAISLVPSNQDYYNDQVLMRQIKINASKLIGYLEHNSQAKLIEKELAQRDKIKHNIDYKLDKISRINFKLWSNKVRYLNELNELVMNRKKEILELNLYSNENDKIEKYFKGKSRSYLITLIE